MTPEHWVTLLAGMILLLVSGISFRNQWRQFGNPLSARGVFALVWGIALVLFAIPVIDYSPVPVEIWLLVYGSVISFLIGTLLGDWNYRRGSIQVSGPPAHINPVFLRSLWLLFTCLGFLGALAFIFAVDKVLGWRAIFETPDLTRGIQSTSVVFSTTYGPFKFLTYAGTLAFLLWTLGMRERIFSGPWRFAWFVGPLSLLPFLITGDRTLMLMTLVWVGFFQLLFRPPATFRYLAAFVIGFPILLVGLFVFLGARVGKVLASQPEIVEHLNTRLFDPLILPYVYLTGNIPAFAALVQDPVAVDTGGRFMLLPVVKVLSGLGLPIDAPEVVGAFYPIPFETFNNYSWLGYLYSDFGVLGPLLVPLIIGLIASVAVTKALLGRRMLMIWMASLLLYGLAFSPLLPKLTDTVTWLFAIAGLVVVPLLNSRAGPRELTARFYSLLKTRPFLGIPLSLMSLTVIIALGIGALRFTTVTSPPDSSLLAREDLVRYGSLSEKTRLKGDYPTPVALASRLRSNFPKTRFIPLVSPGQIFDPQGVGVFTQEDRLVLVSVTSDGNKVLRYLTDGDESGFKVTSLKRPETGTNLVRNSRFRKGLQYWERIRGDVATVRVVRSSTGRLSPALSIDGSGEGVSPVVVSQWQRYKELRNSCFQFRVESKTLALSRNLTVWTQFLGPGGQSVGYLSFALEAGRMNRRSPREDRGSIELSEPVSGFRVFAVDTGDSPLDGGYLLSSLSLKRVC